MLDVLVKRDLSAVVGGDGVDVRRLTVEVQRNATAGRMDQYPVKQFSRAPGAVVVDDSVNGVQPFAGLLRVPVLGPSCRGHIISSGSTSTQAGAE